MRKITSLAIILIVTFIIAGYGYPARSQETLLDHTPVTIDHLIKDIPSVPRLCDQFEGEKMKVDIGDCKLYVEIQGKGIPLVLVHGGPGGTHHFFHSELSLVKDEFKVIYYDQRGCGQSDYEPGEGYCFEQTIDDLEKLRKALKIDRWIVAGHSYGGGIAQYYMVKYPKSVIGTVLIGTVPMVRMKTNGTREDDYMTEAELKRKNEITTAFMNRKIDMAQYFYNTDLNGGWKRQNFRKPSKERIAQRALYGIVSDPEFTTDWGSYMMDRVFLDCPIPMLVCEGRYDLIWLKEKIDALKGYLPRAEYRFFEKSGHNIFSDEPEKFVNTLKEWAASIEPVEENRLMAWKKSTDELMKGKLKVISDRKAFIKMLKADGIEKATDFYRAFKEKNADKRLFTEDTINRLGYSFLLAGKTREALEVFKLYIQEYPESWNAYDSLGEAYLKSGDEVNARSSYARSLELNPDNANAKEVLKRLQ